MTWAGPVRNVVLRFRRLPTRVDSRTRVLVVWVTLVQPPFRLEVVLPLVMRI